MEKFNFDHTPTKQPFQTPEGYFKELPLRMQQRLQQPEQPNALPWLLHWKLQTAFLSLLVLAVGIWLMLPGNPPSTTNGLLAQTSSTDIASYLADGSLHDLALTDLQMAEAGSFADNWLDAIDEQSIYAELEHGVYLLNKEDIAQ